jgi:hypothetical protein
VKRLWSIASDIALQGFADTVATLMLRLLNAGLAPKAASLNNIILETDHLKEARLIAGKEPIRDSLFWLFLHSTCL